MPQIRIQPHPMPASRRSPSSRRRVAANAVSPSSASWLWAAALVPALLVLAVAVAHAHDAPSGWKYPFACCSGFDCRPVTASTINEKPEGYVIPTTGEVVRYDDERVRYSPDGEYHWCSVSGRNDSKTICLFVPPRFF